MTLSNVIHIGKTRVAINFLTKGKRENNMDKKVGGKKNCR